MNKVEMIVGVACSWRMNVFQDIAECWKGSREVEEDWASVANVSPVNKQALVSTFARHSLWKVGRRMKGSAQSERNKNHKGQRPKPQHTMYTSSG